MKEKIKTLLFFLLSAVCGYICGHFAADNQLLGLAMCMVFVFVIMFGYAISMKIYTLDDFHFFGNRLEVETEESDETEEKTEEISEKPTEENEDTQTAE